MKECTAVVNKIIPFSSVDGPGNRTAVFLQGCNINCKYCHNPETRAHCIACGLCVSNCPTGTLSLCNTDGIRTIVFDKKKCVLCDTCIKVCPHDSSPRTERMTANEVWMQVKRQIPFIRGLTVSGGECMLEPDFLTELFGYAKEAGLNTMIDSNGTISFRGLDSLLKVTDGVMLDIKAFGTEDHRRVTDYGNETVLDNAGYLSELGKLFEVRCVIAPSLYDCMQSVSEMADFLRPLYEKHPFRIKIIAYRPMGVRAAYADMTIPDQKFLKTLADFLHKRGFSDIIII